MYIYIYTYIHVYIYTYMCIYVCVCVLGMHRHNKSNCQDHKIYNIITPCACNLALNILYIYI